MSKRYGDMGLDKGRIAPPGLRSPRAAAKGSAPPPATGSQSRGPSDTAEPGRRAPEQAKRVETAGEPLSAEEEYDRAIAEANRLHPGAVIEFLTLEQFAKRRSDS